MRLALTAAALAILLCVSSAHGASVTLYLTGTFADGATLGGTITIDNTAGTVTAQNVTISPPDAGAFTVSQGNSSGGLYYDVGLGTTGGIYPSLSMALATTTLVGYTGGPLCNNLNPSLCGGVTSGLRTSASNLIVLNSGSASTTPPGQQTTSVPAISPWGLGVLALMIAASGALLLRRTLRA